MYSRITAREQPAPSRRVTGEVRWDDFVLTFTIFIIGFFDVLIGVTAVSDSDFIIEQVSSINITAGVNSDVRDLTRLQGAASFEGGIALVLIAIYRTSRYYRGLRFAGFNFSFIFGVGALGRSLALASLGMPEFPFSVGYTALVVRVVVLWISFFLSLYTYSNSFIYA